MRKMEIIKELSSITKSTQKVSKNFFNILEEIFVNTIEEKKYLKIKSFLQIATRKGRETFHHPDGIEKSTKYLYSLKTIISKKFKIKLNQLIFNLTDDNQISPEDMNEIKKMISSIKNQELVQIIHYKMDISKELISFLIETFFMIIIKQLILKRTLKFKGLFSIFVKKGSDKFFHPINKLMATKYPYLLKVRVGKYLKKKINKDI